MDFLRAACSIARYSVYSLHKVCAAQFQVERLYYSTSCVQTSTREHVQRVAEKMLGWTPQARRQQHC